MESIAPDSFLPQIESPTVAESLRICGFWRRFFAFAIDNVILGLAGALLSIPFWELLADLGPAGRAVGFFMGLIYFALPESRLGGGQSLGKRILGIRVVDRAGKPLAVEMAILRYMVFVLPLVLNQLPLPFSRTPWLVMQLLAIIVFGWGTATLYLLIFNRGTRQSTYDLVASSYVVHANEEGAVEAGPTARLHWWIAGALLVLLGPVASLLMDRMTNLGPFPELMADIWIVEQMPGVDQAGVQIATNWSSRQTTSSRSLNVTIICIGKQKAPETFARAVAKSLLEKDPKAASFDAISVTIMRGYDLGFVHASRTWRTGHRVSEWKQLLAEPEHN